MIIGVIGAGTMGNGIAEAAAHVGKVILVDVDQKRADQGLQAISKRLNRQAEKGRIDTAERDEILSRITACADLQSLEEVQIVVEAASEDLGVKQDIFTALARICSEDCILATNTSALSITAIAAGVTRPDRVIGLHFFNPVTVMKLVELVQTPFTSPECAAWSKDFVESLGKTAVCVEESPGFVVNRLLIPMINEAVFLLAEGAASAEDIDTAMRLGANHPMGPLALADLVGLDICLAIMETLYGEMGDPKFRPAPLLRKMVRAGHLGRKTKKGFFDYH